MPALQALAVVGGKDKNRVLPPSLLFQKGDKQAQQSVSVGEGAGVRRSNTPDVPIKGLVSRTISTGGPTDIAGCLQVHAHNLKILTAQSRHGRFHNLDITCGRVLQQGVEAATDRGVSV